jgi:hypothetical protein
MRLVLAALAFCALGAFGCSGSGGGTLSSHPGFGDAGHPDFAGGDPDAAPRQEVDAGNLAAPLPDGGPAPTWTYLYATYFGPGSLGHCGDSGCHNIVNNHFMCGTDQATCYQGMLDTPLIDPMNPGDSRITNPERTPISWFNTGGGMPYDVNGSMPNKAAADEIAAWVYAGAKNN